MKVPPPEEAKNFTEELRKKEEVGGMNRDEILKLINECGVFTLATAEGNKPHVRGMMLYRADKDGILFHTGKGKDLSKQLSANPNIEACFIDFKKNIQIRINGAVELVEDMALKKEVVANRPFMKKWAEEMGYEKFYEMLAVYRLKNGLATTWTIESNFLPKTYITL